ncbi:urea amidolyase associated protein UAAP1 [Verrucomicrobium sp. BvORR034]|uniref:urea amidolyase associated protein UAAP1 n=1 Tax=Verrucomicrobium sp. BvORR034 TaxID=1396418 RepID=UPI0006790167|nr:urea amidolyase associated protein UAAP1 [Verrucomicrobium sp. BvORR034]
MFSPTPDIPEDKVRFREVVLGGASWSHVLKRGSTLRIIDPQGGANVSALFFNFELMVERYNMSDTLKAQHVAFLTTGRALYSDMGRILVSVTDDTSGWHDTICGHSTASLVERKYGKATFQEHRNKYHRNGRDSFLVELGKYGLGTKDLVPNANFFSKVTVDDTGGLHFDESHAKAGAHVDLRAGLNTLVVLNTCPHPLAPCGTYDPKPVHLVVYSSEPAGPDDVVRKFRPENDRGLILTDRYFM